MAVHCDSIQHLIKCSSVSSNRKLLDSAQESKRSLRLLYNS